MTHVVEINSWDELLPFVPDWDSLLQQTPGASFYQSLDWLGCFWRHFHDGTTLRVLIVRDGDTTTGILPLIVVRERTRLGWFHLLTYPLRDWATFYGPIGPRPEATLTAGLRHVCATPRHWDVLDLRCTDQRADQNGTPNAMRNNGLPVSESLWKVTDLVEFQGSWDEYLASRTQKFRENLRRSQHRALRLGDVVYERHRPRGAAAGDGDPNWALYDECVELSRRTWQGACPYATSLSHPEVRDFFRDSHAAATARGAADINVLRINGRAVAFAYNYVFAGATIGVRTGYDPEFAAVSPGSLLFSFLVRDGFARRDRSLDMGTDRCDYKRYWSTHRVPVLRYAHYRNNSPRTQLLRWKRRLFPRMAETRLDRCKVEQSSPASADN
jgi:CelD/BcsL family acetyltransferase involved in cellulose biosynthesis